MEYIVETKNLVKKFPNKLAVNQVNMHIKKGDIYGFIGKNGAGKTTTMKLLLGLIRPTSGEIVLFGNKKLNVGRKMIGSLIEVPGLYKNCTAYENLKRFSILYGGNEKDIQEILEMVGLSNTKERKVKDFSLGMKQRLGIAIALLGNPKLLVLDEPINGLDPAGIKEIRDTILRLNKEKKVTFLISSHLLDELSKIVTTYGIVNDGVLVEEIEAKELEKRCMNSLKIQVSNTKQALNILKTNFFIEQYEVKENTIYLYQALNQSSEINKKLILNGIDVSEITKSENSFENYFIERIGK